MPQTKNNYNFIDYKQPILPNQTDYRTSYYRGTNQYLASEPSLPRNNDLICESNPNCNYKNDDSNFSYVVKSEHQDEFTPKSPIGQTTRADLGMRCDKPQFAIYFDRRMQNNPPRPINQFQTRTHIDYDRKSLAPEEEIYWDPICPIPSKPKDFLYINAEGYKKYLDIYMSTTKQDYVPYTEEVQHGIAKKDNITVWDWFELPKARGYGLKEYPAKPRGKVESMYDKIRFKNPTCDRFVRDLKKPKSQLESETMNQFVNQRIIPQNEHNSGPCTFVSAVFNTGNTEYSMYGSGKRAHSVIDARGENPDIEI